MQGFSSLFTLTQGLRAAGTAKQALGDAEDKSPPLPGPPFPRLTEEGVRLASPFGFSAGLCGRPPSSTPFPCPAVIALCRRRVSLVGRALLPGWQVHP